MTEGRNGRRARLLACAGLAVVGATLATAGRVQGAHSADALVAAFDSVPYPLGGECSTTAEFEAFAQEVERCTRVANELAARLFAERPDHPEVPRLMGSRWRLARANLGDTRLVLRETEALLADDPAQPLRSVALDARAAAAIEDRGVPMERVRSLVELALAAPPDGRAASELGFRLALQRCGDPETQRAILRRVVAADRTSCWAIDAALHLRMLRRVGQPLGLDPPLEPAEALVVVLRMGPRFPRVRAALAKLAAWQRAHPSVPVVGIWQNVDARLEEDARSLAAEVGLRWSLRVDRGTTRETSWVEALWPAQTPLYLSLDQGGRLAAAALSPDALGLD